MLHLLCRRSFRCFTCSVGDHSGALPAVSAIIQVLHLHGWQSLRRFTCCVGDHLSASRAVSAIFRVCFTWGVGNHSCASPALSAIIRVLHLLCWHFQTFLYRYNLHIIYRFKKDVALVRRRKKENNSRQERKSGGKIERKGERKSSTGIMESQETRKKGKTRRKV